MLQIGSIGFASPLALLGLLALPLLWVLLRTLPPPARLQRFPPVALLAGLPDSDSETKSIPLWLRLMRLLAVAAAILGFSDPALLNGVQDRDPSGRPALILTEASWAGAAAWEKRRAEIAELLERMRRSGVPAFLLQATEVPQEFTGFSFTEDPANRVDQLAPKPWLPDGFEVANWIGSRIEGDFDSWWLSEGLDFPGHGELASLLAERGTLTVLPAAGPVIALGAPEISSGEVRLAVAAFGANAPSSVSVLAFGSGPDGAERTIGVEQVPIASGGGHSFAELRLPLRLRNQIEGFEAAGVHSAGAIALAADSIFRTRVALVSDRGIQEGGTLLSSLHFLRRAAAPFAELVEGSAEETLGADPEVIILPDIDSLPPAVEAALEDWIQAGGLLIRFAGPRLAAGDALAIGAGDLLPVRLRPGSRILGGAMSWDSPKSLVPFEDGSPFEGLDVGDGIAVVRQVLAQPGPDLAQRTLAALEDGTPLVTGAALGSGRIVLFHVPANAEWSTLPLSGLFPRMIERLALAANRPALSADSGTGSDFWSPSKLVDAFGNVSSVEGMAGVRQEEMTAGIASESLPPGVYRAGRRAAAVNAGHNADKLSEAEWPAGAVIADSAVPSAAGLKGGLLAFALLLLLADMWATFRIGGRTAPQSLAALLAVSVFLSPNLGAAQSDDRAEIAAVRSTALAFVVTGDAELDNLARSGLAGLSLAVEERTSIELADPFGIDPESGTIAMFPLIYWSVTPAGPNLPESALQNIRSYLRTGGMILFDTRDALLQGNSDLSSNSERLIEIADPLGLPPLSNPSSDHALARSFYLLNEFPGRHNGDIWVERIAGEDIGSRPGGRNDGVTPVVIGGNDWASAWAAFDDGRLMFPVGIGDAGQRQRELAFRFGVNLIMHALTGNYKLDQVHAEALAERQSN